jgi:hypothetical protein
VSVNIIHPGGLTLFEVTWVCHLLLAIIRTPRAWIRGASKLSTEGDIEDDRKLFEMRWRAATGREEGNRISPTRWVRGLCNDVTGNRRRSGKLPDRNPGLVLQMSNYTPTSIIETLPVALITIV